MPPAARVTDMHTCPMVTGVVPHVGGPILPPGHPTTMIGNLPAARVGDMATCTGPPDTIVKGSPTVLIGNMPAARMGDNTAHGGVITVGHPTTIIGDAGSGGGGGGGGGGGASAASGSSSASPGGGAVSQGQSDSGEPAEESIEPAVVTLEPLEAEPEEPAGPSEQQVDTGTHWIGIELVDEADRPVRGERFRLVLPNNKEHYGALDKKGHVRIEGIKEGGWCRFTFTNLDAAAWERWKARGGDEQPADTTTSSPTAGAESGAVPQGETDSPGRWHRVYAGECVSSVAKSRGHFWETIWNHAANAELKRRRADPNVLLPGDAVFIPDKQTREESLSTDQEHKFRRKGEPSKLRLKVAEDDEPRANEQYRLEVDGHTYRGTTDENGYLAEQIPGNARRGRLYVGEDEEPYELDLGHLDPIGEISGIQGRLNNLGFDCGRIDGRLGEVTAGAIMAFQTFHELEPTGRPDQATLDKLLDEHGS